MLASDVYGSLVCAFFCVTLLVPRILKWDLDIWKICIPFVYSKELQVIFYKMLPLLVLNSLLVRHVNCV